MIKNKKRLKAVILTIFASALLATGIFYYLKSVQNSLWNQTVSEILEVTSLSGHAFEIYIEKDMQILDRIVKHLSQGASGDEAAVKDAIKSFKDSDVNFIVIDGAQGLVYTGYSELPEKINAGEQAMMETAAEKGVREPYIDTYTGHKMIGGYERFTFADGTPGIVQVQRRLSSAADEFILSFYDNTGFSYIANSQGDILVRSSHKNCNRAFSNILDVMQSSGNSKETVQQFRDSIDKREEGVMHVLLNGEKNILAFTPVNETDGWYVIAIIPDLVIMKHANQILKSSQIFIVLLGCILVIAGLFIYLEQRSRKKIMEKEGDIQYREQLFGILANSTNDVFLMFSTDNYEVEYISPNVERVLGIPPKDIKDNIRTLLGYSRKDKDRIDAGQIEHLEIGSFLKRETERIHRKNGEPRWFMETLYRTSINDSERFVAVFSDRTHERKSQQALKDALEIAKTANESKSVFLSNMSHDIRTPMNAIVGFSALLQRDAHNPEKVQEYTRKITSSSQHLLGLINDILDMSKIESGKTTLNISEINLAEIVDELGTMMLPQARTKQQDFKIFVYDVCNEELLGDQLRINQILINILSNAIKYTPVGGKIEMTVRQLPQHTKNYARFHFVIKDNGIGMTKEYQKNIFQPFTRENNRRTSEIQGTGLGMAITKNLIDLMGGTIKVESELNQGSSFTLDLELRIKEQDVDPDFWNKHCITKLLVVDDEEDICTGILNVMADTGVQVEYALGGLAAVQMAEDAQNEGEGFDLVMIDWQMPDISGIETARRIRKIVPAHVPIMILTAYDIDKIQEEGIAAGIDGFLQKPFFLSNFKIILSNLREKDRVESEATKQEDNILAGKKILAAEDNELNAEILLELLEVTGAECEVAANGQEAFEKFAHSDLGQYDVILMDVQMPVMNGYEATRAIRACGHPQAKTIPIIAMTANAFSEDVKDALDAGMNEHVPKPIDMEHLKEVINKLVNG